MGPIKSVLPQLPHQPTACGQAGYDGIQGDLFKGGWTRYNTMAIHHRHYQTLSYRLI